MVDVGPLSGWSENRAHPLRRLADDFDALGEHALADQQRALADALDPPTPPPTCPRCGEPLDDADSVEVRSWDGSVDRIYYDTQRALDEHRSCCPRRVTRD